MQNMTLPDQGFASAARPVGIVDIKIVDAQTKLVLDHQIHHNNVLNIGRLTLLQGLANMAVQSKVYFKSCVVGNGGSYYVDPGTGYVAYDVSRDRTALFGDIKDEVSVITTVNTDAANSPYAMVSSVLGSQSAANGSYINEVGLRLKNDELYALVTWPGTSKTSSIEIVLDWFVYFL